MAQPPRAPEGLLAGGLDPGSLRVPEDNDRRRQAEVPVQDYEAHLAACTRKVNKTGYSRSWDFRLRPSSVLFTGVVRSRGMFPPVPSLVPVITPVTPTVAAVTKIAISRVRLDDSWGAHLERRLSAAIQKWVALVVEDPLSFDVGRRCAAFVGNDEAISQGLLHTFSGKSAGTLHSRAGPLIRFVAWAKARQCKPLPFSEALLYDFLLESESTCAPSFGKALMSALAFCKFVLGVENVSDVLSSGRFGGLARSMFLNKRKRRQKPPLTGRLGLNLWFRILMLRFMFAI